MNQHFRPELDLAPPESANSQVGKVAAVTLSFWVIKILVTTIGDVSGDLLSTTLNLGYVNSLLAALVVVACLLVIQVRAARFHQFLYWILMLGTSTVGAELSDTLDRFLHVGYVVGTGALFLCLIALLAAWRVREGKIEVYPIWQQQHELFYWFAIIAANSLGSVFGDLIGDRYGLGILGSVSVNAAILGMLLLLRATTRVNRAALFWAAFVVTRA